MDKDNAETELREDSTPLHAPLNNPYKQPLELWQTEKTHHGMNNQCPSIEPMCAIVSVALSAWCIANIGILLRPEMGITKRKVKLGSEVNAQQTDADNVRAPKSGGAQEKGKEQ